MALRYKARKRGSAASNQFSVDRLPIERLAGLLLLSRSLLGIFLFVTLLEDADITRRTGIVKVTLWFADA
jgi:hypothetical protein